MAYYPYQAPVYTPTYLGGQQSAPYPTQQMQAATQSAPQAPVASGVKGWPVQSENEARNALIDLDGSVFIFPDIQTGKLYTKQINPADFSPVFRVFQQVEPPKQAAKPDAHEEIEQLRCEVDRLNAAVAELQESKPRSRGKKEVESE